PSRGAVSPNHWQQRPICATCAARHGAGEVNGMFQAGLRARASKLTLLWGFLFRGRTLRLLSFLDANVAYRLIHISLATHTHTPPHHLCVARARIDKDASYQCSFHGILLRTEFLRT